MKTLHLVCNSHLDPVWQWDWNEGASATLATFYSAVQLAKKYDYVFCHNEVLLYEYVEKYDPELFAEIQELVAQGKWKIMGGWYVQPDCLVPSGESFIRQSSLGREYFSEKFGVRPTTALNFDSFGHTKGLPSILKKCGYDSYVFCRPMDWLHIMDKEDLPHGPFLWQGYDGATVKALRVEDLNIYCSPYGQARMCIERKASRYEDQDDVLILWGVGNHGGVSSEQDLKDIETLKEDKKGEWKIIHTTLEHYFETVSPDRIYDKQLICFIKSYSSVNAIKLAHDQLENTLYFAEKICSVAELQGGFKYDKRIFKDAERVLAQVEFHDVLSGTAIKLGTDSSIRKVHHAIEDLKAEIFGAFASMAKRLSKVTPEDDNFVVFNPYPYEFNGFVETEMFAMDPVFSDTLKYALKVYDKDGNDVSFQIITEESLINMDRRKRILYKVSIPAFSVASYGIHKSIVPKTPVERDVERDIVVDEQGKYVRISRKTGLLESFKLNGEECLCGSAFQPVLFDDNADPWGWRLKKLGKIPSGFTKTGDQDRWNYQENGYQPFELDDSGKGVYGNLLGVTITEDGELMTEVQSLFTRGESHVVITYKIYKTENFIDVNLHILFNEREKGLKIKLPVRGENYFAQMAFGVENYESNGFEYPCNRYVGVRKGDKVFTVYNRSGIHSVSKEGDDLFITLLNGSAYCAHPTDEDHSLIPRPERFVPYVEQGVHDFEFRVGLNGANECERLANEFNQPVYSLLYFPHGNGTEKKETVTLSNKDIVISAFKRLNNGTYMIRLFNGLEANTATYIAVNGVSAEVKFGKYEFKTLVFDGSAITESELADLY